MPRPEHIDPDWIALELLVPREQAGWRTDRFIAYKIPRLSRTRVQRILETAAFDSQGRPLKANRTLPAGERITIYRPPPQEPETPRDFSVIFEDEWILAVEKPAGLPVHPTARFHKNTLTTLLTERYGTPRPALTHRLDAETSGILLCAHGREAERRLKIMFAKRRISKRYLAVVFGIPDPPEGRVELPLGLAGAEIRVKMGVVPDGQPALTEYRTLATGPTRALVELSPRTGRQHQIRAHLAHLGHPIVGDKMYGFDERLFLDYIEAGNTPEIHARAGHCRQALHASRLELIHPFTDEPLVIESPLPADLVGLHLAGPAV